MLNPLLELGIALSDLYRAFYMFHDIDMLSHLTIVIILMWSKILYIDDLHRDGINLPFSPLNVFGPFKHLATCKWCFSDLRCSHWNKSSSIYFYLLSSKGIITWLLYTSRSYRFHIYVQHSHSIILSCSQNIRITLT